MTLITFTNIRPYQTQAGVIWLSWLKLGGWREPRKAAAPGEGLYDPRIKRLNSSENEDSLNYNRESVMIHSAQTDDV